MDLIFLTDCKFSQETVYGSCMSGNGSFNLDNGDQVIISKLTMRRITMQVSNGLKIHFLLTVLFLVALFLPAVGLQLS